MVTHKTYSEETYFWATIYFVYVIEEYFNSLSKDIFSIIRMVLLNYNEK